MGQRARFSFAVAVIAFAGLLLWGSGHVAQAQPQQPFDAEAVGLPAYYGSEGDMVYGLFEALSGVQASSQLPEGFSEEVLGEELLDGADLYVEGCAVGVSWGQASGDLEEQLAQELSRHGWEHIGATQQSTTYVKQAGEYRWISLHLGRMSQAVSAVVYFRKGDADGAGPCA